MSGIRTTRPQDNSPCTTSSTLKDNSPHMLLELVTSIPKW